jgi:recombination protein RecA
MSEPAAPLSPRGFDALRDIVAATKPRRRDADAPQAPPWTRPNLAGRLVELSGAAASATLTFAVALVLDAQRRGDVAAWVTSRASTFFPPDVAASGVDLAALPVVRVPAQEFVVRAGERLVRCGAFDLVVLDLAGVVDAREARVPLPLLTRLSGLAEKHETAVVFVVEKTRNAPSLGSVVSLRVEARRERVGEGEFRCELAALRDKRRPAGWTHVEARRGPPGLR